jgi:hypothetical protein
VTRTAAAVLRNGRGPQEVLHVQGIAGSPRAPPNWRRHGITGAIGAAEVSMRIVILRVLPALLLALAVGGCGGAMRGDPEFQEQGASLRVDNRSWSDVRVYVVTTAGHRTRLGMVSGSSNATLRIPVGVVAGGREVQFQVDPVGSRATASSFNIFVRPGETITITVPPQVR